MIDPRERALAKVLIGHSTRVQPGEHLLVEAFDVPDSIVVACVEAVREAGGHPHVALRSNRVLRSLVEEAGDDQLSVWSEIDCERMRRMDCYLGIRGSGNVSEMAGVADERMQAWGRIYQKPVHFGIRVPKTRWCVLRWPTASMAQLAGMSTRAFEDFYFDVCTLDYERMAEAVKPLEEAMRKAKDVRIVGPGDTDLSFSLEGIDAVACTGSHNIPDGECFSAPVRDSVNGVIHYNTPTIYHGRSFENVRLTFRDGRIVDATADQGAEHLPGIFDTDEGARFVGEFAIGFNPHVKHAMKDILFDEKIDGSLHFTPGQAYEETDNGNRSEIHWDLVLIQRPEFGGGTIAFDGEVIRRDGVFLGDLVGLNPDALA